jgi:hypothetical protein
VWASIDDELSVMAEYAFAALERMLDELRGRKILPQIGGFEFLLNCKNDRIPR